MAAFTSTQDGDWAEAATWGGGGVPGSGDTATVSHNVDVTTTVTVGGLTLNDTLYITGSLTLAGAAGCASASWLLHVGPGGALDLGAQTITPTAAGEYRFIGTSGSRATVTSTGSQGTFGAPGVNPVTLNWQYCDIDSVAGYPGRTQTSAIVQNITRCTFDNCGLMSLDTTGVSTGAGFIFEYNKVSNWADATPRTANAGIPYFYQTNTSTTAPRRVRFNVFDNSMNTNSGAVSVRTKNAEVYGNIFINTVFDQTNITGNDIFIQRNFFWHDTATPLTTADDRISYFTGNYVRYATSVHMFDAPANTDGIFSGNIIDCSDGDANTPGFNALVYGAHTSTVAWINNILLGEGNILAYTTNPGAGAEMYLRQNTTYVDNAGQLGSGQYFAPILIAEQSATNISPGASEIFDNLHYDFDDSNTDDPLIGLIGATADQIDLVDYNCGWGSPGGTLTPSYVQVTITGGVGAHDFSVDPQFADTSVVGLAAWDASLGGPGTEANAVTELKKRNDADWDTNYDVENLWRYVFEGFMPQNAALKAGRYGGTVGAASPVKDVAGAGIVSWLSARAA